MSDSEDKEKVAPVSDTREAEEPEVPSEEAPDDTTVAPTSEAERTENVPSEASHSEEDVANHSAQSQEAVSETIESADSSEGATTPPESLSTEAEATSETESPTDQSATSSDAAAPESSAEEVPTGSKAEVASANREPADDVSKENTATAALSTESKEPASSAEGTVTNESSSDESSNEEKGAASEETSVPSPPKEEAPAVDYSTFTKEELAEAIEAQLKRDNVNEAAAEAQRMRPQFDQLLNTEREVARQKFVAEGGEEDGFDFRPDATYERFLTAFRQIQANKKLAASDQRKQRQRNLETKQDILDRLREFVDSEETQISMNQLRELQNEWRATGPVPPQHNRSLWANYHALLDRFYDNRSIYYELKELDRKKNLELKQAISERAEALVDEADLRKAISELDELHEEYKHVGPVPKEEQEPLWQRFKAASDKIHDRRRESVEKFKGELEENLTKKQKLVEEVHALSTFTSDSIKEWNRKTKEVQELKKQWEAIGSMPRKKAKAVNRDFWSHFKQFFAHKGEFFKQLDAQRGDNLEKKEALVAKAESLKESEDWKQTSQQLKQLQQQWREIGPVPEKKREEVYQRFKAACDYFFNRRRGQNEETEAEYINNLKEKERICEQIEQLAASDDASSETLLGLTDTYASIGFVPRKDMRRIQDRFDKAVKSVLQKLDMDDAERRKVKAEVELSSLKSSPGAERKIDQKENQLRRKISQMEDDIALWTNNISFFAASKGADKLKADFEQRIAQAQQEVDQLKAQLGALQDIR